MSLRNQIKQDFIDAFKARDKKKADALRGIESAVKQVEIDTRKELSDDEVVKILRGELKKRNESIEIYTKANRQDLVDNESYEASIIKSYLPAEMSREAVREIVIEAKKELGDKVDFGSLMKRVMRALAGRADGKLVAELVKQEMVSK